MGACLRRNNSPPSAPDLSSALGRQSLQIRHPIPAAARYPRQLTPSQRGDLLELFGFFVFASDGEDNGEAAHRLSKKDRHAVIEDSTLTPSQVILGFSRFGRRISPSRAEKIVKSVDVSRGLGKDGRVSFAEFLQSLLSRRGGFYEVLYEGVSYDEEAEREEEEEERRGAERKVSFGVKAGRGVVSVLKKPAGWISGGKVKEGEREEGGTPT